MKRYFLGLSKRTSVILDRYFTGQSMDYRQVIAIVIPIFIDQGFIVLMSLLNTAMVSSSGVAAISAVSLVDSLNMFILSLIIAVATGGTVIVAQYKGSRDELMVSRSASQSISIAALVSLIISMLVIVFHAGALQMLFGKADPDVFSNARLYLICSAISFPFFGVYQAVIGSLRGVGETRAGMVLSIILNLSAFCLNVIFILWLQMGVAGLAISVIASRAIGMLVSICYLVFYNQTLRFYVKDIFQFHFGLFKKIMYIGFPFAAEQMFFNGGKLLTQTFIVQFGTLAITTNAIGGSISMIFQIGGAALSIGIVTIVGQCIGGGNMQDARRFVRSILWASTLIFVLAALIIVPVFPWLVQMYSPPPEIVSDIFILIIVIAIAQPLVWSISFILPSALRAAGDSKFTSITSLLSMWLLRIVLGYYLGVYLGWGVTGIWIAMVIEWGVRGAVFVWRYRGNKWYQHKII